MNVLGWENLDVYEQAPLCRSCILRAERNPGPARPGPSGEGKRDLRVRREDCQDEGNGISEGGERSLVRGQRHIGEKREISREGKMVKRKMSVVLVSWEEERDLIGENGLSGGEESCVR